MTGEACLTLGPPDATRAVLVVPPLFGEAGRMRRTLALMMRALAARGIAAHMPDLPGQNDSRLPSDAANLNLWRTALADFAARVPTPLLVVAVRGGCLIDDAVAACGWWRLAPINGASLLRAMVRAELVAQREGGHALDREALVDRARAGTATLAGYALSAAMIDGLNAAQPAPVTPLRTAVLARAASTPDADTAALPGAPLWSHAEPGEDAAMTAAMADDIAAWMTTCAAR